MSNTKPTITVRSVDRAISGIVASPWLWGVAATFAFYAGLPFLPNQELTARFFSAHWTQYVTTGLFFVGVVGLVLRAVRNRFECSALSADLLASLKLDANLDATATAKCIASHLDAAAGPFEDALLVRRIRDAIDAVIARPGKELEGHLRHLSDVAVKRLHDSQSLVRTLTWIIPFTGLLGTAITISTVVPEQPSMTEMFTQLMSTFGATASALGLSLVLVLVALPVHQAEQKIADDVDDVCSQQLICLFPSSAQEDSQQLTGAIQSILSDHAGQLTIARAEFLAAQALLVKQQEQSAELIRETWQAFQADLLAARDAQTLAMTRLTDSLTGAVMGWSDRLEDATRAMNDQVRELRVQASLLLKLTEQEASLLRMEQRPSQNKAA